MSAATAVEASAALTVFAFDRFLLPSGHQAYSLLEQIIVRLVCARLACASCSCQRRHICTNAATALAAGPIVPAVTLVALTVNMLLGAPATGERYSTAVCMVVMLSVLCPVVRDVMLAMVYRTAVGELDRTAAGHFAAAMAHLAFGFRVLFGIVDALLSARIGVHLATLLVVVVLDVLRAVVRHMVLPVMGSTAVMSSSRHLKFLLLFLRRSAPTGPAR